MKSVIITFALLLAACSGGHASSTPTTVRPALSTTRPGTTTVRNVPHSVVSARVVLKSQTMRGGSSMSGEVIVQNNSGHALHPTGCVRLFGIALSNGSFHQDPAWESCLQFFTIPVGSSRYPVTVTAAYLACSSGHAVGNLRACLKNNAPPPLPPGRYRATLIQQGNLVVPTPRAIAVRVKGP
jgi:hypothetical protein